MAAGATSITIPSATINTASKAASAKIRKCYSHVSTNCSTAATYVAKEKGKAALPAFVTQTGTTVTLSADP